MNNKTTQKPKVDREKLKQSITEKNNALKSSKIIRK